MTDIETKTIDITPTDDGYRMMRRAMKESVTTYEEQVNEIQTFYNDLWNNVDLLTAVDGEDIVELGRTHTDYILEGLSLLQRSKEESILKLLAGINEIDCYLGPAET